MAVLTDDMKQLIKEQRAAYVATATKDGIPNVSIKGSIQVIGEDTLAFACIWSDHTIKNLEANPNVAIAVSDTKAKSLQIKGKAVLEKSGALYDSMSEALAKMKFPKPKCVAKITVTEAYLWPPAKA